MSMSFSEISNKSFDVPLNELDLPKIISSPEERPLKEVVDQLRESKMGSMALIDSQKKLSGIITERDILFRVLGKFDNWEEVPTSQFMTKNPFTYTLENTVSECIKIVSRKEFRHIPVVDESGLPIHMISVNDLMRFVVKQFPDVISPFGTVTDWSFIRVDDYGEDYSSGTERKGQISSSIFMTHLTRVVGKPAVYIDVETSLNEVLSVMQERRVGSILLLEYGTKLKGILTERDFLFKISNEVDFNKNDHLAKEFMTSDPHTLLGKHYIAHAINNMSKFRYRNTIVVDEDRFPIGVVGILDIFKYIADYLFAE